MAHVASICFLDAFAACDVQDCPVDIVWVCYPHISFSYIYVLFSLLCHVNWRFEIAVDQWSVPASAPRQLHNCDSVRVVDVPFLAMLDSITIVLVS
jgi:hypothetical protein